MVTSTMELNDMSNYVHLDEKWFYMTRETRKYYLVPGEKSLCESAEQNLYYQSHVP